MDGGVISDDDHEVGKVEWRLGGSESEAETEPATEAEIKTCRPGRAAMAEL